MHSNNKNLFIVIPVHNRKHFTCKCLLSLRKQTFKNFKVIVVDDGSTDGTGKMIEEEFPDVILLEGDGNLWWTGATNLGVEYALKQHAEYIITLNDDTELTPDFIERMMGSAKENPQALMGAYTLDIDSKRPAYGGSRMDWRGKGVQLLDIFSPEQRRGLHWVTHFPGRGLWIPSVVFRKMGLFDAVNFPQAVADYDFTLRASRSGYKIYCNFDARLYSHVQASGDWEYRLNFSLKNYLRHLTDIKGGGNLRVFIKFAMRHCPTRYRNRYLIKGVIARLGGYPWRWLKHALRLGASHGRMSNM